MPNAQYRNLSLYNRALTDKEITDLNGKAFSFTQDGNLIIRKLVEQPIIPVDALHIPLDFNTKERLGLVGASDESNVTYQDGAIWVGTDVSSQLEFNLFRDYQLDWSKDWTIAYWKNPVGTTTGIGSLTGYNLESLGCNSNTIGGGYVWWGKPANSNTVSASSPGTIIPSEYFNNWRMVSLTKVGNILTIEERERNGTVHTRTQGVVTSLANYFVTQHGYDLKLGGYDNANPVNSFYRNLVISKRPLTQVEINDLYKNEMRMFKDKLQIQGRLREGKTL
jgi:hypothetical protein